MKVNLIGWLGDDCIERNIIHGKLAPNGDVVCDPGYVGLACEFKGCKKDCSARGYCNLESVCQCYLGYIGEYCQMFTCPK